MKILLLGDYSNYHACLAVGLRRLGHEVTVASDGGGFMHTAHTVSLQRPLPGPAGGALLYMQMLHSGRFKGYDIVTLINPAFAQLRPHRLRRVFARLKRQNGAVFLNATGIDKAYMDMVTGADSPLRYNEYFLAPGVPNPHTAQVLLDDSRWQQGAIGQWCDDVYASVNGITTALYEYHLAARRHAPAVPLKYIGIPIDLQAVRPVERELASDGKVKIFLGRHAHRMAFKGTDVLENVARAVVAEHPSSASLDIVENIPYAQYVTRLREADLVLDQIYSYTPATNALLAMAAGQAVASGGEEDYYRFIGEEKLRPVINVRPDENQIYEELTKVVTRPDLLRLRGEQGRHFVAKHNSTDIVAARAVEFWEANS